MAERHLEVSLGLGKAAVSITSACFDDTRRRMITGSSDGTCHVWNFNNGELLGSLAPDEGQSEGLKAEASELEIAAELRLKREKREKIRRRYKHHKAGEGMPGGPTKRPALNMGGKSGPRTVESHIEAVESAGKR